MSKRDRFEYAPLGALALGTVFFLSVLFSLPKLEPETAPDGFPNLAWNCDEKKQASATADQGPTRPSMSVRVGDITIEQNLGAVDDTSATEKCEEKRRQDSDLRAQWVAADSARNSYRVAHSSYWLGVVNFVALVLTLAAAAWAAWASQAGATTAKKALEHEKRTVKEDRRPWVTQKLVVTSILILNDQVHIDGTISATNIGKGVAKMLQMPSGQNFHEGQIQGSIDAFSTTVRNMTARSYILPEQTISNPLLCNFSLRAEADPAKSKTGVLPYITLATVYEADGQDYVTSETFMLLWKDSPDSKVRRPFDRTCDHDDTTLFIVERIHELAVVK